MQLSVRILGDGLQVILEPTGIHGEQSFGAGSWPERKLARPWAADARLSAARIPSHRDFQD